MWGAAGLLFAAGLELVWLVLLSSLLSGPHGVDGGRAVGVGVVAAFAVATGYFGYRVLRHAFVGRARLLWRGDALVVDYPILLKRPLVVGRDRLVAISVDAPSSPGYWDVETFTLEIEKQGITRTAGNDEASEALDGLTVFQLPMLCHDRAVRPNTAVLVRDRLDVMPLRRWGRLHRQIGPVAAVSPDSRPGFLIAVEDPDSAIAIMRAWGVERKLTDRDFGSIEPTERDARRLRRYRWRRYAAIGWGILVIVRIISDLMQK